MKKTDLKQLIKPLVKECIHEVLIEEGLLSNVVAEVAKGMQGNLVVENRQKQPEPLFNTESQRIEKKAAAQRKLAQQRKQMMDAIGNDSYNGVNLFEGTEPMTAYESSAPTQGAADLGHPSDAGVDISSLVGGASAVWKAIK